MRHKVQTCPPPFGTGGGAVQHRIPSTRAKRRDSTTPHDTLKWAHTPKVAGFRTSAALAYAALLYVIVS